MPKLLSVVEDNAIIALCGAKGSGKGVLAGYLSRTLGYDIDSFATPLKRMTLKLINHWTMKHLTDPVLKEEIDPQVGFSPRWFMQKLGTEAVRGELGENVWTDALITRVSRHGRGVIIDDLRFPNEIKKLWSWFGANRTIFAIRLERPGRPASGDKHVSEQYDRVPVDAVLSVPWVEVPAGSCPHHGETELKLACRNLLEERLGWKLPAPGVFNDH